MKTLIANANIVNEGLIQQGSVLIIDDKIENIIYKEDIINDDKYDKIIDAQGLYLIPGVIDDHVHFRDPGLTYKADVDTESRAALAGGVTYIMDMPNTSPPTISLEEVDKKTEHFNKNCHTNFSLYIGATPNNAESLGNIDHPKVCGVKLFMGSTTGNMMLKRREDLEKVFKNAKGIIATHCEEQSIIDANTERITKEYEGRDMPYKLHPIIRSTEACYKSTKLAIELAEKYDARLHVLHITSAKELELFSNLPIEEKKITSEVCVNHLVFSDEDYDILGGQIKCNPSIKTKDDREALREAVRSGLIDVIGTDHAPHLIEEKRLPLMKCPSGIPSIQFSLLNMLKLVDEKIFTLPLVVEKMCHAPAKLFNLKGRGYIKKGYYADLVLLDPNMSTIVTNDIVISKCKWTPFDGNIYNWKIREVIISGNTTK